MANVLMATAKKKFLDADIDLLVDTIKVVLIDTGTYTFSAAHEFLSDVSGTVGTAQTLGTKTTTGGVFDSADVTFSSVSGNSAEAIYMYKDTGVAGTSALIAYYDTASSGLPVTPNGGDITITVNGSGWFAL